MQLDVPTRIRALLALTLTFTVSLSVFVFLRAIDGPVRSLWRGYYTVLVSDLVDPAEVVRTLRSERIGPVLSSVSATVEIQAYDGMATVQVSELDGRLDPLDPRYDPYLRAVSSLFHTGRAGAGYGIYYVPARTGIFAMHGSLRRALSGVPGHWFMVEWQRGASILLLFPFVLALGYLVFVMRSSAPAVLLATPAWAMVALNGGAAGLLIATGSLFSFALLVSVGRDRRKYARFYHLNGDAAAILYRSVVFFASWIILGGALFVTQRPSQMLVFVGAVTVTVMAGGAAFLQLHLRLSQAQHRLFMPLALSPRRAGVDEERAGRVSLVFTGIAIVALLVGSLGGLRGMPPIPQPGESIGSEPSFENLETLWNRSPALPTLADYVAHRAFHEGLMYGRSYGLPAKDEIVSLPTYERDGDNLERSERVILVYDESWLNAKLRETGQRDVAALFVTHGGVVGVEMQQTPSLYSSVSHLIQNSALILLVLLPFLVARGYLRPRAMQGVSYVALRAQRQGA